MIKILIVGATSAMAEATARIWAQQGQHLFLVARDREKLEGIAADLKIRGCPKVETYVMDANDFAAHETMLDRAELALNGLDTVLIAHGVLSDQAACQLSVQLTMEDITTNALSVIALLTLLSNRFEIQNKGSIAVISSVAGDRGRKSNYVYGAAKGFVSCYVEGLQHRFAKTNINVVLIKPGPTDTPMTAHLKQRGMSLTPVSTIAKQIVYGIDRGQEVVYAPGKWKLIMWVLRHLPTWLFNKITI